MKRSFPKILLLMLLVFAVASPKAEVVSEATAGSGYQGNLFSDSNSTGDAYAFAGMEFKYYPSSKTQLAAGAKYNTYSKYSDLSNLTTDLSFTIIPIPASSPFSLTLSGALGARKFGQIYRLYDQVGATASAQLGYSLASWGYWQVSAAYLKTSYSNSDYGSNRTVDLGTGLNFTLLGSNSIALKASYARRSFDQPTIVEGVAGYTIEGGQNESETFEVTGFSARFSRPLGESTGLNFSAGHRKLHVDNDYAVLGYTIDYLSPWSDLWDGASFSGGLKHFFPGQITTEFSFAYYDKSFVDVVELAETNDETYWQDDRSDQLTTVGVSASKAITLHSGKLLTPSIYLGYRQNESTTSFFDYSDVQLSFALRIGL